MLVVMDVTAGESEIESVVQQIRKMGLDPHPIVGAQRTAIGITGNRGPVDPAVLENTLKKDPSESEDLAVSEGERLKRMVAELEQLLGAGHFDPEERATIDDPQHLRELRGAGYAGGADDE